MVSHPRAWFSILLVAGYLGSPDAHAIDSSRQNEINECRSGEMGTWGDGADRPAPDSPMSFTYSAAGAPAWFPEDMVIGLVGRAARAWSRCGVGAAVVAPSAATEHPKRPVVIQWSEAASGGNFGLANLGQRTLSLGPKAFELLRTRNPRHDASQTLQMVISHEMGHLFGLIAHSRRCIDVLSYYHNGRGQQCFRRDGMVGSGPGEYRHVLPTACDIERCRRANGMPPLPGGRLDLLPP